MEDERRHILELVEQGRLSAQEANDLLAALEEPEEEPPVRRGEHHREPRCGRGDWGRVGESASGIVDTVMRALFRRLERRGQRRQR
ncbi:MAG: hypothetical protein WBF66_10960 [Dehalococcoidia bacterium]